MRSTTTTTDNKLLEEFENLLEENLAYAKKLQVNKEVMAALRTHIQDLEVDALTAKAQEAIKARQVQKATLELEEVMHQVEQARQQRDQERQRDDSEKE